MRMIMGVLVVALCVTLTGCAGLIVREDDSAGEIAGKVATRVILCPLTVLCLSEIELAGIKDAERRAADRLVYHQYVQTLSPEERAYEHELERARIQAAGQALMGLGLRGGLFRMPAAPPAPAPIPAPLYQPRPSVNCLSNQVGESVYTNCY